MAQDNVPLKVDAAAVEQAKAATDAVTYAAQTAHVALVRLVQTSGPVGARVMGSLGFHLVAAASTNAANLKNTAALLYSISGYNNAAYPVFIKLHNTASPPTVGTTPVVRTFGIQAGQPLPPIMFPHGLPFSVGLSLSIVKGIADSNSVAVAASDCVIDVEYA